MKNVLEKEFHELYYSFKPKYKILSPLQGFLWHNNEVVEKYYNFCSASSYIKQILEILFYQTNLVEFDVTTDIKNPASYFSVKTIAKIMTFLCTTNEANHNELNYCEEKSHTLFAIITNDEDYSLSLAAYSNFFQKYNKLNNLALSYYKNTKDNINQLESQAIQIETQIQQLLILLNKINQQAEFNPITAATIENAKNQIKKLKTEKLTLHALNDIELKKSKINVIQNLLRKEDSVIKLALDDSINQLGLLDNYQQYNRQITQLNDELVVIKQTLQTTIQNFQNNVKENMINAGFDKKFIEDNCQVNKFHRYLEHRLIENIKLKNPQLENLINILKNLCLLLIKACQDDNTYNAIINLLNTFLWLKSKKDMVLLRSYTQCLENLRPDFFINNYTSNTHDAFSQLCAEMHYNELYGRYFPPLCITTTCTPYAGSDIFFSDCGESSLRNFINVLIKNQDTMILDVGYLHKVNLNIDKKIIKFYENNSSLNSIKRLTTHNQWAEIASSLNKIDGSIHYFTPKAGPICELVAGGENMLKVIKILFGTDDLKLICSKFSQATGKEIMCDITNFHPENNNVMDYENYIKITVENKHVFYWYFLQQHFRCKTTDIFEKDAVSQNKYLASMTNLYNQQSICKESFFNILSFITKNMSCEDTIQLSKNLNITDHQERFKFIFMAKL
ncbi:MAG: hypothetical protein K2P99_00210, partial [Burkholderiales bacterium]|nr:hypothetical protein [Burkholderiales bacterium]